MYSCREPALSSAKGQALELFFVKSMERQYLSRHDKIAKWITKKTMKARVLAGRPIDGAGGVGWRQLQLPPVRPRYSFNDCIFFDY